MLLTKSCFASGAIAELNMIDETQSSNMYIASMERSFSQYSLVVSDRRRNLLPQNAELLTMVNFNKD